MKRVQENLLNPCYFLVEPGGIEPPSSSMPRKRAPAAPWPLEMIGELYLYSTVLSIRTHCYRTMIMSPPKRGGALGRGILGAWLRRLSRLLRRTFHLARRKRAADMTTGALIVLNYLQMIWRKPCGVVGWGKAGCGRADSCIFAGSVRFGVL